MPTLEGYRFGRLIVDGKEQTRDVIVLPERVITNWWRIDGHRLVLEDFDDVREDLPEHLVIGTGAYGQMRPDPKTLEELRRGGIEVEALPTADAVRRYKELDPHRTAAALHLTCRGHIAKGLLIFASSCDDLLKPQTGVGVVLDLAGAFA